MRSIYFFFFLFISCLFFYKINAQSLTSYQEQAARNNPGLLAQYKTFEAALQRVDQVKALQDPTLSFSYFISPVETRVGPQRAKLSLSQMFPWFGTRALQSEVATLQAEAQYEAFLNKKNKLAYQVAAAYYPLYELEVMKRIEAENIRLLESLKKLSTQKFEQAEVAMVDVIRVDIMLEESKTNLMILEEQVSSLQLGFNKLVNRPIDSAVVLPDSLVLESYNRKQYADSSWAEHPEIKAWKLQEQASQKAELLAQKRGLPKIGVGLDYVMIGDRTDLQSGMAALADNGKDAFMPMVSVSLPIFRKSYKAAVKESQLMQENYQLQQQQSKNMLMSELSVSEFELQKKQQLIQLYASQLGKSEQVLRLYESAYANGGSSVEELINMQQKLLQYQKQLVKTQVAYLVEQAKTTYLLGGQE